jgi:RND family efflux transporter MFP subunit
MTSIDILRRRGLPILLALITGCSSASDEPAEETEQAGDDGGTSSLSLPVVGAEVRRGDLILSVTTTAQISSESVVNLRAEAQGIVAEVPVLPGATVKKGTVILRLDPRPFDLAVEEAQAAVAEARLRLLDNTVPDSIVTGKPVTGERLRNAEVRSGLDAAEVRLARAEFERERSVVRAPFDGVLDDLRIAEGERITAGQEIGKLVDLEHLRIDAAVLEHDLPLIRVGGAATVTTAASPDVPVRGRIAAVLPLVDSATRAGRALIRVPGNGLLRPGMYADVRLEASRLPDRVIVPLSAVIERDGRPLVFVVRNGRAQWTYLTTGRSNGFEFEVLPDSSTGEISVQPGDTVLVEGHLTLTHDAPVRVVPRAERPTP